MTRLTCQSICLLGLFGLIGALQAQTTPSAPSKPSGPTFDLKYKFRAGETLRTKVLHTSSVQTTIKGTDETAESFSESVKVWKVADADPAGKATFVYSVEYVNMRGKIGSQAEVMYDSRKDAIVPEMYRGIAKTVGQPLSAITLDARGTVLRREQKTPGAPSGGAVTIPLPQQPIPAGHIWEERFTMPVVLEGGASQSIHARHRFELVSVEKEVARIGVQTQILDPALPPKVEVQIMQRLQKGDAWFDIAAGRIIRQAMEIDQSVIDFHGAGSRMKCRIRFTEELLPDAPATAQKQVAAGKKPIVTPKPTTSNPATAKPNTPKPTTSKPTPAKPSTTTKPSANPNASKPTPRP